jgi:hypothetical protein
VPPLPEIFAVCDDLNEQMILTADTMNRLSALVTYESFVMTENDTSVKRETDVNDATVTQDGRDGKQEYRCR